MWNVEPEKMCDKVDRDALWKVLCIYGVWRKLPEGARKSL